MIVRVGGQAGQAIPVPEFSRSCAVPAAAPVSEARASSRETDANVGGKGASVLLPERW